MSGYRDSRSPGHQQDTQERRTGRTPDPRPSCPPHPRLDLSHEVRGPGSVPTTRGPPVMYPLPCRRPSTTLDPLLHTHSSRPGDTPVPSLPVTPIVPTESGVRGGPQLSDPPSRPGRGKPFCGKRPRTVGGRGPTPLRDLGEGSRRFQGWIVDHWDSRLPPLQ